MYYFHNCIRSENKYKKNCLINCISTPFCSLNFAVERCNYLIYLLYLNYILVFYWGCFLQDNFINSEEKKNIHRYVLQMYFLINKINLIVPGIDRKKASCHELLCYCFWIHWGQRAKLLPNTVQSGNSECFYTLGGLSG